MFACVFFFKRLHILLPKKYENFVVPFGRYDRSQKIFPRDYC